jgi:hypothetical protein
MVGDTDGSRPGAGLDGADTEEVAARIAPVVDSIRHAIASGIVPQLMGSDYAGRWGVSPLTVQGFSLLRHGLSGRSLALDGFRAAVRYSPRDQVDAALAEMTTAGLVDINADTLTLTAHGRAAQEELWSITDRVVADLWTGYDDLSSRLEGLCDRALTQVADDPGPSFHLLYPPHVPATSTAPTRLAEQLSCLRFHRADAHAAAWLAAGFTGEQVTAPNATLPDSVEADTNTRAARPYQALSPSERTELIDGLLRLPGGSAQPSA